MLHRSHRTVLLVLFSLMLLLSQLLAACDGSKTPTAPPSPTPRPTATPSPEQSLGAGLYTISRGDQLIATEEIEVSTVEGQLVVTSVIHYRGEPPLTERRGLVLTPLLNPARYDLVQQAYGLRSVWVGERQESGFRCFANNIDWYAPMVWSGIEPQPELLIEAMPSALPFAVLAVRILANDQAWSEEGTQTYQALNILADKPITATLTVGVGGERESAVIGTVALAGELGAGPVERFTMWVRPDSRQLYAVELPDYRFAFWQQQRCARYAGRETITIQRVASLPDDETPTPASIGEPLAFEGPGGTRRDGYLHLPEGQGPAPCLVIHDPAGMKPALTLDERFLEQGWAIYHYDRAGRGESEGDSDRGRLEEMAGDAILAAQTLAEDDRLDADRIVFVGIGDAARVGALLGREPGLYAGLVLVGGLGGRPLLPDLVAQQVSGPMAEYYGWTQAEVETYLDASVGQWQEWLFADQREVAELGRRASLEPLIQDAGHDAQEALSKASVPVLLLHGAQDQWIPVEDVQTLSREANAASSEKIDLDIVEDVGHDLAGEACTQLDPALQERILIWLTERY